LEVYYGFISDTGVEKAHEIMEPINRYSISFIDGIGPYYHEAARLKGIYSISLADSIAAAAAKSLSATLITKDGEFEPLEKSENLSVYWIRPKPYNA
jgi:predicted nucleic acid-binding protein